MECDGCPERRLIKWPCFDCQCYAKTGELYVELRDGKLMFGRGPYCSKDYDSAVGDCPPEAFMPYEIHHMVRSYGQRTDEEVAEWGDVQDHALRDSGYYLERDGR